MDIVFIFVLAGLIIFLGFFGEIIFRKTRIPDVLFLIFLGILISKVFGWVDPLSLGIAPLIFTTFALLFLTFEGSLGLDIYKTAKELSKGSMLTIANFVISIIVASLIARLFGLSWLNSILLGVILGGTSAEVVLPIIRNLSIRQGPSLTLTIETALSDILCIVGTITVVQVAALGVFSWGSFLNNFFGSFLVALVAGLAAGILWVFFLRKIENISKSYMITIAFVLLLYGLVKLIGYDGTTACLAFGLVLGNSRKILSWFNKEQYAFNMAPNQKFFFSQISFFLKTFFFVYLGMIMDFSDRTAIIAAVVITIALFLARPLAVYATFRKGVISKDRAIVESIIPKGLTAVILAQIPVQYGISGAAKMANIVMMVVFISIILSAVLVFIVSHGWFKGFGSIYSDIYTKADKKLKREFKKIERKRGKEKRFEREPNI